MSFNKQTPCVPPRQMPLSLSRLARELGVGPGDRSRFERLGSAQEIRQSARHIHVAAIGTKGKRRMEPCEYQLIETLPKRLVSHSLAAIRLLSAISFEFMYFALRSIVETVRLKRQLSCNGDYAAVYNLAHVQGSKPKFHCCLMTTVNDFSQKLCSLFSGHNICRTHFVLNHKLSI